MILEMDDEALATPLQPWIVVIYPPELAAESPVGPGPLIIGRSGYRANLVIEDDLISRRHCRLYFDGGTVYVEDLGSTNGTFIDGAPVQTAPLAEHSKLQIGRVVLQLQKKRGLSPQNAEIPLSPPPLAPLELQNEADEFLAQIGRRELSLGAIRVTLSIAAKNEAEAVFVMGEVGEVLRRELLSDDLLGELSPNSFLLLTSDISSDQLQTFVTTLRGWIERQRFLFEGQQLAVQAEFKVLHLEDGVANLNELLEKF